MNDFKLSLLSLFAFWVCNGAGLLNMVAQKGEKDLPEREKRLFHQFHAIYARLIDAIIDFNAGEALEAF